MPIAKHFTFLCTEVWPSETTIKEVHPQLPFLFLSSERDELVPTDHQKQLFELSPSVYKKFFTIKDATHNDPVVYQPYWVHFGEFWNYIVNK
jgi:abhydrolase domain-containing protein 13